MTIGFTRTGGIAAAPGLRVRAVASLGIDGGTVTAGGYSRSMSAAEADALAASARHATSRSRAPRSHASRDVFAYRFVIETDDGGASALTLFDDGGPLPDPEQRLLDWARAEADAISSAARSRP